MKKILALCLFFILRCCALSAGESKFGPAYIYGQIFEKTGKGDKNEKEISYEEFRGKADLYAKSGVTELGIERDTCLGDCPAYRFIIRSDGSFRYEGLKNSKFGNVSRTGKVAISKMFFYVAQEALDLKVLELSESYNVDVSDMPTVFGYIAIGSKKKVVRDYAGAGPLNLWTIEMLLDSLMESTLELQEFENTKKAAKSGTGGWFSK